MDRDYFKLMPRGFFDRLAARFITSKDHQRELLDVMSSTIIANSPRHNDLQQFDGLLVSGLPTSVVIHLREPAVQSYLACLLITTVWPRLIHQDVASIQPMSDKTGIVNYLTVKPVGDAGNFLQMTPAEVPVTADDVHVTLSSEVLLDSNASFLGLFFHLASELALELNLQVLTKLVSELSLMPANLKVQSETPMRGFSSSEWDAQVPEFFTWAALDLFKQRHGDVTHLFGGNSVLLRLLKPTYPTPHALKGIELPQRAGLTELHHVGVPGHPQMRTYRVGGWRKEMEPEQLLLTRHGGDYVTESGKIVGDSAVFWAPHAARCSFNNDTQAMTFGISSATFIDPSNAQLVRTRHRS